MDKKLLNHKFQLVFKKLLEPNYSPYDHFCLDKLLTHLSDTIPDINETYIDLPAVMEFIISSLSEYDNHLINSQEMVKVFLLKLIAKTTEKEVSFLKLIGENVYANVFSKFDICVERSPSVKLALLDMLRSMLKHSSGVDWLVSTGKWLDILQLCQQNQTIYFFRHGTKFIVDLTWKLNDLDRINTCEEVLKHLVSPLLVNKWSDCVIMDDEADNEMYSIFYPSLTILTEILLNVDRLGKTNSIVKYLSTTVNIKLQLCHLFHICRKTDLLVAIAKLFYIYLVADISVSRDTYHMGEADLFEIALIQCNTMASLLSKRNPMAIIEMSSFTLMVLCKLRDSHNLKLECEKEDKKLEFTNQIIILSLVPMLCSLKLCKNELVDAYIQKLVSCVCQHTTRLIYSFRDLIKEKNDPLVVVKAIQNTVSYAKYLDKSQAVLIFQSYFYCLQNFIPLDDDSSHTIIGVNSRETTLLLSTILEAIYFYIEHFGIQWQETVESLCVHNFCARVLKTTNLDSKLIVLAFKLSELTIRKFLSPNLALLMNSANGSVIEELSKNIYIKLHDPNWCVRDSAMELLYVVVDISEHKFTAFQQQVVENDLPELIVTQAFEDSETYVRATALKCLSVMVKIKLFWENHLKFLDLPVKIMKLLFEESEGLIRKEAVYVITNMYKEKRFNEKILDDVFITMFHSAVKDLHWEVQLGALDFWRKVIHSQMSHQGMIDGVFPSVTFSKENRKIVQLTDMEIKKRLRKILNELSIRGCLGALLGCMNDESEIQVMEKSLDVISEIYKLLERYDFLEIDSIPFTSTFPQPVFSDNLTKTETEIAEIRKYRNKADVRNEGTGGEVCVTLNSPTSAACPNYNLYNVIEYIVNTDDVNLLANVYKNQLKVNNSESSNNYDFGKTNGKKDVTNMFVDPSAFMKTIKETDYKKIIDQKNTWRKGISTDINSIIEDILAIYEPQLDVNILDCY